jgi:hypothetical protein
MKSAILRRNPYFSEEHIISIFRVEEGARQETVRGDMFFRNVGLPRNYTALKLKRPYGHNHRCENHKSNVYLYSLQLETVPISG